MSEHDHEHCGCGCGHNHDEEATVTLTLDDGTVVQCAILTIFPVGEHEYIALLPMDDNDNEEGEVFLYRFQENPEGEPVLENIEDDDEYEVVADAFEEFLDSAEFDELVDGEE
jgi:Protein of unknown function (DUF1292).